MVLFRRIISCSQIPMTSWPRCRNAGDATGLGIPNKRDVFYYHHCKPRQSAAAELWAWEYEIG